MSRLQIQVRRKWGAWSQFQPFEDFLRNAWIFDETRMRTQISNGEHRYVDTDGTSVGIDEIISELERLEDELFEKLSGPAAWKAYLDKNPNGRFKERAETRLSEREGSSTTARKFRWDAFVSHASADAKTARHLVARLKEDDLSAWIDDEQIEPGDSIVDKIEEGLTHSRWVLTCLSHAFRKSSWCRKEYGPALAREVREGTTRVIPVLLDDDLGTEDFPKLLAEKHYVRLNDPHGWHRLIKRLRGDV